MRFTEDDVRRIKDASQGKLLEIVQDFQELRKSGVNYICDCPKCHNAKKFSVSPSKDLFGCFSCKEVNGAGALSYLMRVEGKDYVEALD